MFAIRQVTPANGVAAGRTLRRWYRAKGLTTQITVVRVEQATGRVYYRRSHKRKRLFIHNRGFFTVNDGPAFASQLARTISSTKPDAHEHSPQPCAVVDGKRGLNSG